MFMKTAGQNGQGLIEYLILVALIAVGTMATMRIVGQSLSFKFATVADSLGAEWKEKPKAPTIDGNIGKKRDLRNFMHGSKGRGQGEANENETE